ncbi:hypothetical protein WJX77_010158 [Trebouxia sp. C0004]
MPALCAALRPALVLPTITPGLDTHSMVIHEGEHDDKVSGHRCGHPSGVSHQLRSVQGSPYKIAQTWRGLLAAAVILFTGMTRYWSSKRKAATHFIAPAPSTLRMGYTSRSANAPPHTATAMTPLEWRTGGRTYTARWPHTDKPGSSMGSTFQTTATSRHSTAVATAASARSKLASAAKIRQAQLGAPARSVKAPAMVNSFNLSCSADTNVAVRLASADKQRTGPRGGQAPPCLVHTDCFEDPVGVHATVPVAGGDALEGTAAQMQESSHQVIRGAAASSHGKWKGTRKVSMKGKLKGSLKSLKTGVQRHLCSGFIPAAVVG